jgi:2-iminobutanoate/2-iminopropanoate deaminase
MAGRGHLSLSAAINSFAIGRHLASSLCTKAARSATSGEIRRLPVERQVEIVLDQIKLCLTAAGTSLDNVIKCNVYCTDAGHFATINAVYARYFPLSPPARSFICVQPWHGPFDVEIDCVATA